MGDPELFFSEDGTPRSGRFGDIYYSPQDGLAESRAVFLQGCHLDRLWQKGGDVTILELGFGTGLNIAAVMQHWVRAGCPGHLHIFSVEAFVITRDQAAQALANWPEIAEFAQALGEQWPRPRRGFHHMDFPQWKVSVTVALMPVKDALLRWRGQADAVFLDGFSPAANPDMWAEDVLALVAACCRPGARLATFTVAGAVRRGLQAAGFSVAKCPGHGRKRERLEAVLAGEPEDAVDRPRRMAVVGAGIAGAAVARQAVLWGMEVTVFDAAPGSGASGNAAALVTPRLDAGDNAISALYAEAFYYATELYRRLCPEAILGEGVLQCAGSARDEDRFGRIVAQAGFVTGDLTLFAIGERADVAAACGVDLVQAPYVVPSVVVSALIGEAVVVPARVTSVAAGQVMTGDGVVYDGFDAIVVACGDGILDLSWAGEAMALRPVRGQVEVAAGAGGLTQPVAYGGYAIPLAEGVLFGATHDREDRGCDVRTTSRDYNLAALRVALPQVAEAVDAVAMTSRASIRVTTRDYLPVVGSVAARIYVLTGLGARGFCLAPLLARGLLAEMVGVGDPLSEEMRRMMRPERLV